MSKEKQIEGIIETMGKSCASCFGHSEAEAIYNAGYRKQSEGMWEIVTGSSGQEKMVCTNCRHQQDLASTFTYCPNCGARMRGSIRK